MIALHAGLTAPHELWSAWGIEPAAGLALVATGGMYARGVQRAWTSAGRGRGIGRLHVLAFTGAMLATLVALASPLDALGGTLFSAHMVQHLLLVLVAAPLAALAAPDRAFTWALPDSMRRRAGRWTNLPPVAAVGGALALPLTAFVLHTAALWIWHVPAPYTAAVASDAVHAVEHATFLLTGLLFWWVVLRRPRRRTGYGLAVMLVFASAMQSGLLGALITFASASWYPVHARGAALWGMTPLEDQQLAGLIMWVPAGLVYVVLGAALAAVWVARAAPARVRASV